MRVSDHGAAVVACTSGQASCRRASSQRVSAAASSVALLPISRWTFSAGARSASRPRVNDCSRTISQ
ncbi:hypothetical protein [Nannocystis pusilla]|uniref:hypothetical protein n=1 Tax=Nannocystis pusilla TaxID=889268 RepID=UPI003B7D3811